MSKQSLKLKIFLPMFNVEKWINTTFNSIRNQTYEEFEAFFIDDCSEDNTVELLTKLISSDDRFKIIRNEERRGIFFNRCNRIKEITENTDQEDIIVTIDGDDWLSNKQAIQKVYDAHTEGAVYTHGSYLEYPQGILADAGEFSEEVKENCFYRKDRWRCGGLRTFRKFLLDKVTEDDGKDQDGQIYKSATDLAFTFPMLENSGGKIKHFSECLYVYNRINPLNCDKLSRSEQVQNELRIRGVTSEELRKIHSMPIKLTRL